MTYLSPKPVLFIPKGASDSEGFHYRYQAMVTDLKSEKTPGVCPLPEDQFEVVSTSYRPHGMTTLLPGWKLFFNSFDDVAAIASQFDCVFAVGKSDNPEVPIRVFFKK